MKLRTLTLREIRMPLLHPFETSFGSVTLRRILLIEAEVDGVAGWGECVAGETPFYSPETIETAAHIIRDFIWPILKGRDFDSADDVWHLLTRVRGHEMAKGGVEAALWDAEARIKNVPLAQLLGGVRKELVTGVSIGIKPSLDDLVAAVETELAAGYQRIKIKIKPGWDVEPVRRLRERFPRIRLMVDANSAYTLADLPLLQQLEALSPDDDRAAARLGRSLQPRRIAAQIADTHMP